MFDQIELLIRSTLESFAYDPMIFYGLIVLFMILATFGFPISEEVIIISAALVAYIGAHPENFPPPVNNLNDQMLASVTPIMTAIVCFLSVFFTDLLLYMIGYIFRERITNHWLFKRFISQERKIKIDQWMLKYGYYASGLFRFTPGLKFIGYITCGVVQIPIHKFILINGGVALLVIPSQVFIISAYGEPIVNNLKTIIMILGFLIAISITTIILRYIRTITKILRNV